MLLKIIALTVIATVIFFFVKQLLLCFEYEEWKKAYIPVSDELGEVISRVKFLQSLEAPTVEEAKECIREFHRMKRLGEELERLWSLNPRRQGRTE